MEEYKSELLNEMDGGRADFADEEFARVREYVERRDRATAPATAATPTKNAPAPSTRIVMFMPSTVPELRGHENLATFLQWFRTWACVSRCNSALNSEITVKTSGTPLVELERLHDRSLVDNPLKAWQALTKALEKEEEMLKMVIDIGPLPEVWRALTKIAAETEVVAYGRTKREFETLEIGVREFGAEYFARVHIILMKLGRHKITTPAREIKGTVLGSSTSSFPNETRLYARRGEFDLKGLENGLARADDFQSEQERRNTLAHALAVAHAGSGRTGAGGGACGRGRQGRRSGKRPTMIEVEPATPATGAPTADAPRAAAPTAPMAVTAATTIARVAAAAAAAATAAAAAISAVKTAGTAASAVQPLGQLAEPPLQQQYRSGAPHQRKRHRGEDQSHWQRVMCQQCGEEEQFPAECRAIMPAPAPQHRPYAASSFSGAYAAQYGTCPPPLWTSHDSDGYSTASSYEPSPPHDSYAPSLRCHDRSDLTDPFHRRLPRNPSGASPTGNPRLYGPNTCLQASFRV